VHVVFFNRSFHPDTAATGQLLTELCEDLVQHHGCRVTVVAGVPLLPADESPEAASRAIVGRETHRGIDIRRARGTRFAKRRFVGRATNYVSYFLSACWAGLSVDRPDVVVALTDPPIIGLAAWLTAKRFRVPLIMAYQDIFPEVGRLLEDFRSDTVDALLRRINRFLCTRATRIVTLGDTMRQRLIDDKRASPDRTVVISNWADTSAITPGPRRNTFSATHGLNDKFVVMHSGNLGLSQSLETIVDAAALLRYVRDIQFVFQGEGVRKPALQERARAFGLGNVTFLPFQPKDRLGESFAAADVFVVSLQRGLAGYIVPSKLYGILAAGRPFVAAVEEQCEVASIATSGRCGVVAEPGSARDLADKVLGFYEDRAMTAAYGSNARNISVGFDRRVQVSRYAELFAEAIATHASRPSEASAKQPSVSQL
jgi:putative colanic acid biosynthesis glycosyltransferase WcaI